MVAFIALADLDSFGNLSQLLGRVKSQDPSISAKSFSALKERSGVGLAVEFCAETDLFAEKVRPDAECLR